MIDIDEPFHLEIAKSLFQNKKNLNNLFYIFVTAHLIIWTLVPTLTNNNLPLDTIEHLAWGSNLDWGFDKHPPMVAVFLEIFYQIFGAQDWSYYLLSQLFVIISFYFVFRFSNEIFANKTLSLLSVFIIEAIYFYNFTTPEFNVNVCQLPFWTLTVYYSWKIYNSKQINFIDCLLVGLFAGFGFLSKYLFIYLLVSIDLLFIYLIFFKKQKKFDFKYLITLEVFIIILIPHLVWLFNNDFITIKYGLARTGVEQWNVLDHIKSYTFTHYPIFEKNQFLGVLSDNGITHALAQKKFNEIKGLYSTKLKYILDYDEHKNDYISVSLKTSIFELFETMQHQKNDIETILITKKDHIEGASSILGLIVSKSLTKMIETYIIGPQ